MKIVSFNVNGIRARQHQLEELVKKHNPDVIGLQEIKVRDEEFPLDNIQSLGYHVEYFGQKSHYGVALMSKEKPVEIMKGYPTDSEDAQRRLIMGSYQVNGEIIHVINGYFPQGENENHEIKFPLKRKFYADLMDFLDEKFTSNDKLAIIGDMNISPEDIDIGIGEQNAKRWLRTGKCSFLPVEREWMNKLKSWGLKDSYRHLNPEIDDKFSWFDYRSKGFDREPKRGLRIDLILATNPMIEKCTESGIDYEIRGMEKPSDHCPVWSEFSI